MIAFSEFQFLFFKSESALLYPRALSQITKKKERKVRHSGNALILNTQRQEGN